MTDRLIFSVCILFGYALISFYFIKRTRKGRKRPVDYLFLVGLIGISWLGLSSCGWTIDRFRVRDLAYSLGIGGIALNLLIREKPVLFVIKLLKRHPDSKQ